MIVIRTDKDELAVTAAERVSDLDQHLLAAVLARRLGHFTFRQTLQVGFLRTEAPGSGHGLIYQGYLGLLGLEYE